MKKKKTFIISALLITIIVAIFLTNFSKIFYYFNDAVSFNLKNESGQSIYAISISFGTKDTIFGRISGENADGTPLIEKENDCMVLPIENGDLNNTKLKDMVFDFYIIQQKEGEHIFVGRVIVVSTKLHQTYDISVIKNNDKLVLSSYDSNINIIYEDDKTTK